MRQWSSELNGDREVILDNDERMHSLMRSRVCALSQ